MLPPPQAGQQTPLPSGSPPPQAPPGAPPVAAGPQGAPPPKQGTGAEEIVMQAAQQVKSGAISPPQFIALLTKLGIPPQLQQQICQKLGIPWTANAAPAAGGGSGVAPAAVGGQPSGGGAPPSPQWDK